MSLRMSLLIAHRGSVEVTVGPLAAAARPTMKRSRQFGDVFWSFVEAKSGRLSFAAMVFSLGSRHAACYLLLSAPTRVG